MLAGHLSKSASAIPSLLIAWAFAGLLSSPARAEDRPAQCQDGLAILASPVAPWSGAPLRVVFAAEKPVAAPKPLLDSPSSRTLETAIFAGGCFWGVEGVFSHVKGVQSAVSGYSGGKGERTSYEAVATGRTGTANDRASPEASSRGRSSSSSTRRPLPSRTST